MLMTARCACGLTGRRGRPGAHDGALQAQADRAAGGGQVLMTARRAMESITLDRGEMHMKDDFSPRYAEMVYNGLWFSPERYALQAAVDATQNFVTGVVRVKLYKARAARGSGPIGSMKGGVRKARS